LSERVGRGRLATQAMTVDKEDKSIFGCCKRGECEPVVEFLKKDAGMVNDFSPEGHTPLHIAVEYKHVNLVRRLVQYGSDVNARATANTQSSRGYTPSHFAARNGDIDILEILVSKGADLKKNSHDMWTPMHCAAFSKKTECIKWLIEHKAPCDAKNENGLTPICFAINHGQSDAVRHLLAAGASLKNVDSQGDTPMHHAMHIQMYKLFDKDYVLPDIQIDAATLLAINGADITQKNRDGMTPMHFVEAAFGGREFVRFLTLLIMNAEKIRKGEGDITTQWNYMTILAIKNRKVWEGIGIDPQQAADLVDSVHKFEEERKRKKEKPKRGGEEEEWMAPGEKKKPVVYDDDSSTEDEVCPVEKPADGKETAAQLKARGVDPSNGMCPFFSDDADCSGAEQLKAAGKDPSGGLCPYFQTEKKDSAAAPIADDDDLPDVVPQNATAEIIPQAAPAKSQPAASQPVVEQPARSQPAMNPPPISQPPISNPASQPASVRSAPPNMPTTADVPDTAWDTSSQPIFPPYPYYWPAPPPPAPQPPPVQAVAKPDSPPDVDLAWAYENRTAILCCIICFLLGMWWERKIA